MLEKLTVELFLNLAAAGVFGFLISLTYIKTGKGSTNFARSLVILPMIVCVVITMVNGSLGTSVAIVGAFSLIRFRSLQGNSRDIAFVFFAMTIGLACSVGFLVYAAIVTAALCAIIFLLNLLHYAEKKTDVKELRVTIPENLDYNNIFDDLFLQYTGAHELIRVKTTNMGSLYELTYDVKIKDASTEKEFLDAIRCRNGNLTVVCGRKDYNQLEEL